MTTLPKSRVRTPDACLPTSIYEVTLEFLDGFVVGVSGAHPWYDEAFATGVAAYFRAEVKAMAAGAAARNTPFGGS